MPPASTDTPKAKLLAKRAALAAAVADILLDEGLADLPLRELAARLGTSDRMLLYYFPEKAALTLAAIAEVANRLNVLLGELERPAGQVDAATAFADTAALMAVPGMSAFRAVWADILARGGRGEAPFADLARGFIESSIASIEARLAIGDAVQRRQVAAGILAAIEGVWLLNMVAPESTDGALQALIDRFS